MNLMFYNFNDFNNGALEFNNNGRQTAGANGKRPVTSGALNTGMRTQNNFYKNKTLIEDEKKQTNPKAENKQNIHD